MKSVPTGPSSENWTENSRVDRRVKLSLPASLIEGLKPPIMHFRPSSTVMSIAHSLVLPFGFLMLVRSSICGNPLSRLAESFLYSLPLIIGALIE